MSLFRSPRGNPKAVFWPGLDKTPVLSGTQPFAWQSFDAATLAECNPAQAKARAQEILGEAKVRAQEIERQAYEEGFSQGQRDGRDLGEKSLEHQVQRFQELTAELSRQREALCRRWQGELLELILLICRKLAVRELSLQPEAIGEIVEEGFRHLLDTEKITLRVHPQDYEILSQAPAENWPRGLELVPDAGLEPGGFLLDTPGGEVDGTVEARWASLAQVVRRAVEKLPYEPVSS